MEGTQQITRQKRERGYVPGAPVDPESTGGPAKRKNTLAVSREKRVCSRAPKQPKKQSLFTTFPPEVFDKIVDSLVTRRAPLAVILLGMVNKEYHLAIRGNVKAWYRLYQQWRGPLAAPRPGPIRTAHGLVTLRHTLPRHLPNFRDMSLSIT